MMRELERHLYLYTVDEHWRDHLYELDHLKGGIGLRAYGQRDPLIEYKVEAFKMFDELMVNIKTDICRNIFLSASSLVAFEQFFRNLPQHAVHSEVSAFGGTGGVAGAPEPSARDGSEMVTEATEAIAKARPVRAGPKVGRNDPCPCGSGKKYKQCCGR